MDILPFFLTRALGAGAGFMGLVEGAAETSASLLKLVSGWLWQVFGAPIAFGTGAALAATAAVLLWASRRESGRRS